MSQMYAVPLKEMPILVRDFAAYKSGIQNCSSKTVSEYLLDLRTFFRYIVASRDGIDPESEEFLCIDIRHLDLDFMASIRTSEIYAFLQYSGSVRKNLWAAKARGRINNAQRRLREFASPPMAKPRQSPRLVPFAVALMPSLAPTSHITVYCKNR